MMMRVNLVIIIALACLGAPLGHAQTPQQGAPNQEAPSLELEADAAFQIGEQLRCPVCQGMPIAESPSTMAQDMMTRVREMLAAGKTEAEIFAYFVGAYGEWVLLKPRARGFNVLVWILPPLGFLFGVLLFVRWVKKTGQATGQVTGRAPVGPTGTARGKPAAGPSDADDVDDVDDPYLAAIREEVER